MTRIDVLTKLRDMSENLAGLIEQCTSLSYEIEQLRNSLPSLLKSSRD